MAITRFDFAKFKNIILKTEQSKMQVAVDIVEAEAQDLCPVDKGNLFGSFSNSVELIGNEIVGTIRNSADYAAAVEFGTKPHTIEPRNKPNLTFKIDGKWISTKKVNHPGTQAIPFLRGAMIGKKREVMEILDL